MGKESSGASPNGRGSVKWPEIQEIIIQVNLTVKYKRKITLPAYDYMDVHFSRKSFPTRTNK